MAHSVYCSITPCTCGETPFPHSDPFGDWVDEPLEFQPRKPPQEVKRCAICNKPTGNLRPVCKDVRCAIKFGQQKFKAQVAEAESAFGRIQPRDTDIITTGMEVSDGKRSRNRR